MQFCPSFSECGARNYGDSCSQACLCVTANTSQIVLSKHSSILTSQIVPFHPILHEQSPLVLLQSTVLAVIQEQLLEQLSPYVQINNVAMVTSCHTICFFHFQNVELQTMATVVLRVATYSKVNDCFIS
jgi:hypothetical protein